MAALGLIEVPTGFTIEATTEVIMEVMAATVMAFEKTRECLLSFCGEHEGLVAAPHLSGH